MHLDFHYDANEFIIQKVKKITLLVIIAFIEVLKRIAKLQLEFLIKKIYENA